MEAQANQSTFDKAKYLVWEDLTVMLSNLVNGGTRKLLSGLSGYAAPARIMAIIGPSGSGKTTLLDSLAGRLSASVIMTGKVLINGKKRSINCRDISYVTQEDVFLGTLTVREAITYSAHLRLPTKMTKDEINEIVEEAIMEMGLQGCADGKIGNWHLRGISSGEKKRLSICLEILTHPHVLFLDEPTCGLDSASAFFVIQTLRNIAHEGRIVICSIHQPSSDVFDLFDDLFILSGGEAVFFGKRKMAVEFFADAGYPCPIARNPSDHFLRCICSDFDIIKCTLLRSQKNCGIPTSSDSLMNLTTTEIRATLIEKYKSSQYSINTGKRMKEITLMGELVTESTKLSNASMWKQLCTLTRRSSLNMFRDMGYYWIRIALYILISVCVGTIYFDIGKTYWGILARQTCDLFIYGFMINLSIGGMPSFNEEMKVFFRERSNGHYGEAVFVLSNFLSSFPFLVATGLSSGSIIFNLVNFNPGFSHYAYFCISLFSYIAVTESCMMVVASLVPNILMGIVSGIAVIGGMIAASDTLRPVPELPKIFWQYPMSYISFTSWALQGQHKNDMIGLEFDPMVPGEPKVKGEIILKKMYGINTEYSKWWDLAVVMFLLVFYRLLFFMALKYKEKASSVLHRFSAKRTLRHFARRRPSLRREQFISSKRHQPLHPLSSQEGLSSPLP